MNRVTKQVVYGIFYGLFVFAIFFGGYRLTVSPIATCTDGTLNRDEVEVDCGGSYCQLCEIKKLLPIQFSKVILLPSYSGNGTTALIEIQNKNVAYGTDKLFFSLKFYGSSTEPIYESTDAVAMYPSEVKYRLAVNAPIDFSQVRMAVATSTSPVEWRPINDFARPKTPLREVKFEYSPDVSQGTITGYIKNDNPFDIRRVTLSALVSEKTGNLVAASKTFVQDLLVSEERYFRIDVRLPGNIVAGSLADPKISLDVER